MIDPDRLEKQLDFIVEADKIKKIVRMNYLADGSRLENDAEHSWHFALMAVVLSEYANDPSLNVLKVVKMALIHDLVEIDAGDAYVYDEIAKAAQYEKEKKAADRIFNLLPEDLAKEYRQLWDEFETGLSAEAKFARALDRLHPILMNYHSKGKSWKENKIRLEQAVAKNRHMEEGSKSLWAYCKRYILEKASRIGYFGMK